MSHDDAFRSVSRTLNRELEGLMALKSSLAGGLSQAFTQALTIIQRCDRVVVTGIGKSGHIAQKVASTLASTGTPAYFVHPCEAGHGDLGMITDKDSILAFSWSGETVELTAIINYAARFQVPLISVTSSNESTLAKASTVVLGLPPVKEACPMGLAPTTSTVVQMAIGDCLAIALLESKGFTSDKFKMFHPGGRLGAQLLFVSDLMHKQMPLVPPAATMGQAMVIMTEKALGCVGVVDHNLLVGIITDGDLRRHIKDEALIGRKVSDVMTADPKTVATDLPATAALAIMNREGITCLFAAVDGEPVGVLHIHDLLRAGVI